MSGKSSRDKGHNAERRLRMNAAEQTELMPIKTVSEANQREHWAKRHKRKVRQQSDFRVLWKKMWMGEIDFPCTIVFTRYSCKLMDSDNLAGAFKHIQDELARILGIDDGDGSVQWRYLQERIPTRGHYISVTVMKGNGGI